jgi:polysaccharide export outer membrane protein
MRGSVAAAVRAIVVTIVLISAATAQKKAPVEPAEPPEKKEEPTAATGAAAPVDPKTYQIGPEDVLAITVWREPDVSRLVQVRPDGKITLPLAGELTAGGHTPLQLQEQVTKKLSEFINQPVVNVAVQSVQSKKYYLAGEVNRSGAFPLVVPTTVLEAINSAGGFREFANKGKIVILRGDQRLKFNYNEVIKGKNLKQNIYLENGDHIIVP